MGATMGADTMYAPGSEGRASMSTEQISPSDQQTTRSACDVRLRTVFPATRMVWIIDEQYDPIGPVWRVNLLCQVDMGRWMLRRYRYDIPSDTLYFAGERPATDSELLAGRRGGRRL
jgi:hypothetical protein